MRAPLPTRPRLPAPGLPEPKPQRSPSLARRPLIVAALLILVALVDRAGAGLAGPAQPPPPIQASSLRWLAIAEPLHLAGQRNNRICKQGPTKPSRGTLETQAANSVWLQMI